MLPAVSGFFVARFSGLSGFLDFVACLVVSWTHSFPRAQRGALSGQTLNPGDARILSWNAPQKRCGRLISMSGRSSLLPFAANSAPLLSTGRLMARPDHGLWHSHAGILALPCFCRGGLVLFL